MSGPHRIRLQAAWRIAAGGAVWIRSFGRPTGVGPDMRIGLVIERPAACTATLNGRSLPAVTGGVAAWRHDVTADLRERNELRLEFAPVAPARAAADRVPFPEPLGVVSLEITAGADGPGALDMGAA